jgi:RNA polymerase-binding transcription factor DksA
MSDFDNRFVEIAESLQAAAIDKRVEDARKRQCDEYRFREWDKETCFDCGNDMPKLRLDMGRVRCIFCQTKAERNGRA